MKTKGRAITAILAATLLAGCESYWIGTAGEMRVEVEVYKGPLSQARAIQVGELQGVIADATDALNSWKQSAIPAVCEEPRAVLQVKGSCEERFKDLKREGDAELCRGSADPMACGYLVDAIEHAGRLAHDLCRIEINPFRIGKEHKDYPGNQEATIFKKEGGDDRKLLCSRVVKEDTFNSKDVGAKYTAALDALAGLSSGSEDTARRASRLIGSIAASLKAKAFRVAYALNGYVPKSHHTRRLLADFALLAAEFSNQIQARNVVLQKQIGKDGRKARALAVSDYLRDASNTDFLKLYDWYQATSEPHHKPHYPPLRPDARVRAAERLFRDYYWEKINEVYASGLGKSSMAFIKNAVGNWELKSFSNDPTELLEAYGNVTSAALKSAASLAGGGGGVAAKMAEKASVSERFLALANTAATGRSSGAAAGGGFDVASLHARTKATLVAQREGLEKEEKAKKDAIAAKDKEISDAKAKKAGAEKTLDDLATKIGKVEAAPETCPDGDTNCKKRDAVLAEIGMSQDQLTRARDEAAAEVTTVEESIAAAEAAKASLQAELAELRKKALARIDTILGEYQEVITALKDAVTPVASSAPEPQPDGADTAQPNG